MHTIETILQNKVLVLDGAMGTMIQQYNFTEEDYRGSQFKNWHIPLKGNNDLLSITQPQAILEIHEKYLKAGADIIETNTFSSTSIAMADYDMQNWVEELNIASAQLARQAADKYQQQNPDKPRFVAGSIGPTNKTASISPDVNDPGFRAVSFDELKAAYKQQAKALIEGGVDILLVETIFDTLNAKAALFGIQALKEELNSDIPVMVSGTITDASGRTLSGQTVEAFLISLSHIPLLSIGLNCALGAQQLTPYLERLSKNSALYISAHPNAGLPNAFGEYDESPQQMQSQIQLYFDKNIINIIGGCCGTTPQHIKAIADLAQTQTPRKVSPINAEG